MIIKVLEISSDTVEAIRVILFKDKLNYSIIIEGKTSIDHDDFSALRPAYSFKDLDLATAKFESLVEELRAINYD